MSLPTEDEQHYGYEKEEGTIYSDWCQRTWQRDGADCELPEVWVDARRGYGTEQEGDDYSFDCDMPTGYVFVPGWGGW